MIIVLGVDQIFELQYRELFALYQLMLNKYGIIFFVIAYFLL